MFASLGIALRGFWTGWRIHRAAGPLVMAALGTVLLVGGVVSVHGFSAKQMIWTGAVALVTATVWNVRARATCAVA